MAIGDALPLQMSERRETELVELISIRMGQSWRLPRVHDDTKPVDWIRLFLSIHIDEPLRTSLTLRSVLVDPFAFTHDLVESVRRTLGKQLSLLLLLIVVSQADFGVDKKLLFPENSWLLSLFIFFALFFDQQRLWASASATDACSWLIPARRRDF